MKKIALVICFDETGIAITRLPEKYKLMALSVEEQAMDPKSGLITVTKNPDDISNILNSTLKELKPDADGYWKFSNNKERDIDIDDGC